MNYLSLIHRSSLLALGVSTLLFNAPALAQMSGSSIDLSDPSDSLYEAVQPSDTASEATQTNDSSLDYLPSGQTSTTPPRDGGWQWLADVMYKLEPSTDTSIPETPTQTAQRISSWIAQGQAQKALDEIDQRLDSNISTDAPTEDVQLRFLQARAYVALGQTEQAVNAYQRLTYKYPELAEPWNNMASLQMKLGLVDQAYESLSMAIKIRPDYPIAQQNLGLVHLLMAQQAFTKASQGGSKSAKAYAQAVEQLLKGK